MNERANDRLYDLQDSEDRDLELIQLLVHESKYGRLDVIRACKFVLDKLQRTDSQEAADEFKLEAGL